MTGPVACSPASTVHNPSTVATVYLRGRIWWARWYRQDGSRTSRSTGETRKRAAQRLAAGFEAADRLTTPAPDSGALQAILERAAADAAAGLLDAARAARYLHDIRTAADPGFRVVSLRATIRGWIASQAGRVSASTLAVYSDAARHFTAAFPAAVLDAPVSELTRAQVEAAIRAIATAPVRGSSRTRRASTVNQSTSIFRRMLQSAVDSGQIPRNPATGIRPLRQADSTERAPFTPEEVATLIGQATAEWRALILIAAHTGLRLSDVLSLTPDHVHGGHLVIRPRKTGTRVITVPLSPDLVAWFRDHRPPWFSTLPTKATGTISTQFRQLMARAGIPRTVTLPGGIVATRSFHSLRHSFVSWLAAADIPQDVRQRLAGHSDAGIHALYTHRDASLARAIEVLPDLHAAAGKPAMETRRRRRS